MNVLTKSLADVCRSELLAEKWLLSPSLRVGNQWLETVARSGQACLNVHVKTLLSLAVDLAAPLMAERAAALAPDQACVLLIERVLREVRPQLRYLRDLEPSTQLAEAVWHSINSLRLSGVSPSDLTGDSFEVAQKGRDLVLILREYERLLATAHLVDKADVLRLATARLQSSPDCLTAEMLVLIPQDLEGQGLEKAFLVAIPRERTRVLAVDLPASVADPRPATTPEADRELLRWLFQPQEAPPPHRDGTLRIHRAVGEVHEVRQVLRECLAAGVPWDEVELLHTDSATYVPLVYETCSAIVVGADDDDGDLPVTFSEGIPCRYSRPGRALKAWLAWIQDDFSQAALVNLLREGLLALPDTDEQQPSFARLAGLLRGIPIGLGRDRYLPKIQEQIVTVGSQLAAEEGGSDDEDDGPKVPREVLERKLRDLQSLQTLLTRLLAVTPDPQVRSQEILQGAASFLSEQARSISQLDRFAVPKLLAEVEDLAHWLGQDATGDRDVWQWLETLAASATVLGSGPRPGCLHVASLNSGGHSGRRHTFLLGMDDSRFPGGGRQDPLLLDGERRKISATLPTASARLQESLDEFARLLVRLRGNVTLSFACRSLDEDREMFPSPVLLSVYRLMSGRPAANQEEFQQDLPSPAGYAPNEEPKCIDLAEWWLWRLTGPEKIQNPEALVYERFPHLDHGRTATLARQSDLFTPFDGFVPEAGRDLDPTLPTGRVMSSSALQTLAGCPRKFFFKYALEIAPPEDTAVDRDQWLDAMAVGSLLHELFEEFVQELIKQERLPTFAGDWPTLKDLLERKIQSYRELTPPPNSHAFERQKHELEQIAATFLREEERFCVQEDSRPVFLEASLGMEQTDGHATPLDTEEPIPLSLSDGRVIRIKGRVDRIDRLGSEGAQTYGIWDYKTGSTWGFNQAEPFQQGRKIQPYLYVTMVAHCLRRHVGPKAQVRYFGFFFPGLKAVGDRLKWTAQELRDGKQILESLCQTLAAGAFVGTNAPKTDCTYCEYRPICEPLEFVAPQTDLKLANPANKQLEPICHLRPVTSPAE